MAVVILPADACRRQQRRCVTFKDSRFTEPSPSAPEAEAACIAESSSIACDQPRLAKSSKHRCHTVMNMAFDAPVDSVASSAESLIRHGRRAKTLGAEHSAQLSVSVVAPGGGTGMNAPVYAALARKGGFTVDILGQSRAPYDRYPACWSDGAPPPNLESFSLDLLDQRSFAKADCLVVGSRGGQVVLPTLWEHGKNIPPVVVMNGGCAMGLPTPVQWPSSAVSFLLLGGHDYFRGNQSMEEYLVDAQSRVPRANQTTAILLVHEMVHMPQADLLMAILSHMIRAVTAWKASGDMPIDEFITILAHLRKGGWSGKLSYKIAPGEAWKEDSFP